MVSNSYSVTDSISELDTLDQSLPPSATYQIQDKNFVYSETNVR